MSIYEPPSRPPVLSIVLFPLHDSPGGGLRGGSDIVASRSSPKPHGDVGGGARTQIQARVLKSGGPRDVKVLTCGLSLPCRQTRGEAARRWHRVQELHQENPTSCRGGSCDGICLAFPRGPTDHRSSPGPSLLTIWREQFQQRASPRQPGSHLYLRP